MIPFPVPFFRRAGPSGGPAFVQAVFSDSIVVAAELPVDDTIPLITEGTEILTLTVTPQSAASRFLIDAAVYASPKFIRDLDAEINITGYCRTTAWALALFRDATCIQAQAAEAAVDDPCGGILRASLLDAPSTGSPVTWSVRVGPSLHVNQFTPSDTAMGLRVNGECWRENVAGSAFENFNHRLFGGAAKSTLIVQELV